MLAELLILSASSFPDDHPLRVLTAAAPSGGQRRIVVGLSLAPPGYVSPPEAASAQAAGLGVWLDQGPEPLLRPWYLTVEDLEARLPIASSLY